MKKFAFIGAGSLKFTTRCIRDLLLFPAFDACEFALMDINRHNLEYIVKCVQKILREMGRENTCKITATMDRAEALKGADGVLCTVFNGDIDVWQYDILIPKKYGVDINVGDTRSVAGIFRALRNIPLMLDICRDIERYCPRAVFLNYSRGEPNPQGLGGQKRALTAGKCLVISTYYCGNFPYHNTFLLCRSCEAPLG